MYISKKLLISIAAFAVALTAFAATWRSMNIVSSTINSTTIGATTPSTVAATTLSASSSFTANGSFAQGSAFKHQRGTTCTTPASPNGGCSTTVTWNSAFPDTNYTYICTVETVGGFVAYLNEDNGSKTAASIHFQTINTPGNSTAANGTYDCAAWHD